jgi:hypothetical protein
MFKAVLSASWVKIDHILFAKFSAPKRENILTSQGITKIYAFIAIINNMHYA